MLIHGGNYGGRDDRMKNPRMKRLKIVFGIPLESSFWIRRKFWEGDVVSD